MPYRYLDDIAIADIAFEAWGKTIGEMFLSAADAAVEVMAERLDLISPEQKRRVLLDDKHLDMLLFQFLQEIIFYKDAESILLRPGSVEIEEKDGRFLLTAELRGELIDPEKHELNVDVKAVTLHNLKVEKSARGWEATVVLDV